MQQLRNIFPLTKPDLFFGPIWAFYGLAVWAAILEASAMNKLNLRLLLAAFWTSVAFLVYVGGPTPLQAQTFYGSIVGTVTDSSNAVVPGATVSIRSCNQRSADCPDERSGRI